MISLEIIYYDEIIYATKHILYYIEDGCNREIKLPFFLFYFHTHNTFHIYTLRTYSFK